jgi:hypothetical protein
MKGRNHHRRAIWLRVGCTVALAIAMHLLDVGSASATTPASAAGPAGAPEIVLGGFTSQHFTTFFKISPDGRVLLVGGITIGVSCTSGQQIVVPDEFGKVPIAANGKLHTSYSMPPTAGPNGSTLTGTDTLKGQLSPKHSQLIGTWRLRVHIAASGGQSEECDSGTVHFRATS